MAEYDPGDKNLDPQLHEAVKKFDEARARGEDASLSWDAVNLPYGARVD